MSKNTSDTKKSDHNINRFSSLNCFGRLKHKNNENNTNHYLKVDNKRLKSAGNTKELNNYDEKIIIDSVDIKGKSFNIYTTNKFNDNSPNFKFEKYDEKQQKKEITIEKEGEKEQQETKNTDGKGYFKVYPKKNKFTSDKQDTTEIETEILNIKPVNSNLKTAISFKRRSQSILQSINNQTQPGYTKTGLICNVKVMTNQMAMNNNKNRIIKNNNSFKAVQVPSLSENNRKKRIKSGTLDDPETKSTSNHDDGNQNKMLTLNNYKNTLNGVKNHEIIREKFGKSKQIPKTTYLKRIEEVQSIKNLTESESSTSMPSTFPTTNQLQNNVTKELSERFKSITVEVLEVEKKASTFSLMKNFFKNLFSYNEYDGPEMNWEEYHKLQGIEYFLKKLKKNYPNLVRLETIGKTCEGRSIRSVRISSTYSTTDVIVVEAGIHAREWITPATATFIMNYLLSNWNELPSHLKNKTWIFFPCVNPDGYHYTWTQERLWRKNRKKRSVSECVGVDLNRNFEVGWDLNLHTEPCHINYGGPKPFSERETRAIRYHLLPLSGYIKAYIALHTYGQEVRFHWGLKEEIPYIERVREVAHLGAKKMSRINNVSYTVGDPHNTTIFGTSRDWARKRLGVKYAYLLELRDRGFYGFLLPAPEIIPTAQEAFEFIATVALSIDADRNHIEVKAKQARNLSIHLKEIEKKKYNKKIKVK